MIELTLPIVDSQYNLYRHRNCKAPNTVQAMIELTECGLTLPIDSQYNLYRHRNCKAPTTVQAMIELTECGLTLPIDSQHNLYRHRNCKAPSPSPVKATIELAASDLIFLQILNLSQGSNTKPPFVDSTAL